MSGNRFLSEDEQRARVRMAALQLEQELVVRLEAGERGLGEQVESVQRTLKLVGREAPYREAQAIRERHDRLTREAVQRAAELRERQA